MAKVKIRGTLSALIVSVVPQIGATAPYVSDQGTSKGFAEDSTLNVLLRNYYFNRDRKNGLNDYRDWTLGLQGVFSSGFTQGTVGVGVDAFGYSGIRLWGPDRYAGSWNLAMDSKADGSRENDSAYGKAGAAAKFRVSHTQIRIGDMQPVTSPVFALGGTRLTPQTATGIQVMSSEIADLELEAGHFWSSTSEPTTSREGNLWAAYAFVPARSADYIGGRYAVNDRTTLSLYAINLQDVWNQYYWNTFYVIPFGKDDSLSFDLNLYRTLSEGAQKAGVINNTTWSFNAAYSFLAAHTVSLGYQKVHGNTPYDYVGVGDGKGSDAIYLANSSQYSDFNGPHEQSLKLEYGINFATYGLPGLTFRSRYSWGWGIDGTDAPAVSSYRNASGEPLYGADGKHHEIDSEFRYVVQGGAAKDLSFRVRGAIHSGNVDQGEGDIKQLRVIIDYPISVL